MEMTQKILDDYNIRQKTNVISDRISVRMTDLSKVELTSTELDVNIMNAKEEEGGAFAQEVQDEFLPELISDDPLDDQDEADEEGDAEVKEFDAFIQQMEDQVKEFNRNWWLFGITPRTSKNTLNPLKQTN